MNRRRGEGEEVSRDLKASVTATAPMVLVKSVSWRQARPAGARDTMPALLIRTSMRPWVERTWSTAKAMEVSEVTSSWRGETVPLMDRARREDTAASPRGREREQRRMW